MSLLKKTMFAGCFAVFFLLSGCGRFSVNSGKNAVRRPDVMGTRIEADCIVTFFDTDGSEYVSRQKHVIYPESRSIEITASEPEGDFAWYLENGVFTALNEEFCDFPIEICNSETAHATVLSVLAGGGFLGDMPGLVGEPENISGQWYHPIQLLEANEGPIIQTVLKNSISHDIEWIKAYNKKSGSLVASRNYNRLFFEGSDKSIPTAIDIFNTDKNGKPDFRIIKMQYRSYELVGE